MVVRVPVIVDPEKLKKEVLKAVLLEDLTSKVEPDKCLQIDPITKKIKAVTVVVELKLSKLIIDVDKDWGGRIIKNLGAPVDPTDSARKTEIDTHNVAEAQHGLGTGEYLAKTSRSDQLVSRDMMEYPTEDVSLVYLAAINKIRLVTAGTDHSGIETLDSFADKAVEGYCYDVKYLLVGRSDGIPLSNAYEVVIVTGYSTADFRLEKHVAGVVSTIAYEAVDLGSEYFAPCKL